MFHSSITTSRRPSRTLTEPGSCPAKQSKGEHHERQAGARIGCTRAGADRTEPARAERGVTAEEELHQQQTGEASEAGTELDREEIKLALCADLREELSAVGRAEARSAA